MQKTIITGITGFVGTNLQAYLGKEYAIKGVSRKGKANTSLLSYADLSQSALDSCEAFVHLGKLAVSDLNNAPWRIKQLLPLPGHAPCIIRSFLLIRLDHLPVSSCLSASGFPVPE